MSEQTRGIMIPWSKRSAYSQRLLSSQRKGGIKELRRIEKRNDFPSYNYACDVSGVLGNTVPLHNLTNNHDKFYINLINAFFLMK